MKFDTKVAWATFGTFFALVVVAVTLIVVLTRNTTTEPSTSPFVTPTPPFVTPSPSAIRNLLLKDAAGECYQFANLAPVLGAPVSCTGSGYWIEKSSTSTGPYLTYDGGVYETCIQPPPPNVPGGAVLGTVGSGCVGIQLSATGTIKDEPSGFCINNLSGVLTWGSCDTAYVFAVESLTTS